MKPLPFPTSLPGFQRLFPDEESCLAYLYDVRWPEGFECEHCHWTGEPYRFEKRPEVYRCRNCKRDTSLTAGTIMHRSHMPLSVWFWGAYLLTSNVPGMSALQFQRQLDIGRYETAFQMLHKLRAGMVRPDRDRIGGEWPVEIDETYVGGRTKGEGHGRHHKIIVVGAVEIRSGAADANLREPGAHRPRKGKTFAGRLRLHVVPDRKKESLEAFVLDTVEVGSDVVTDGWVGYAGLPSLGYNLTQMVIEEPEDASKWLPMVHIIFSNLKAWLLGVHHGVSQHHLQAYLNEFTFRFNRRFYPFNAFRSLLNISSGAAAPTYEELYQGEWIHPNGADIEPDWRLP